MDKNKGKLDEELKKGVIRPFYLLFGEEHYLIKENLGLILDNVLPTGENSFRDMNQSFYEGKSFDIGELLLDCETMPFLLDRRLILVKNSGLFAPGRKDASEALANSVDDIPETSVLVFSEENVDKRSRLYKKIAEKGFVIECEPPSEKELIAWITKAFKSRGKKIGSAEAAVFLKNTGPLMNGMEMEAQKLSDYLGDDNVVTIAHIESVCNSSLDAKIFDMVDAIGNKRLSKALDIYNNLLSIKESPLMILTMIARQFKMIAQCRFLADKGLYSEEISREINTREFIVRNLLSQAKHFPDLDYILTAFKDCLKTDLQIKTGEISDRIGVELLILKYGA